MEVPAPERRLIEWTGERCVPWADDLQMVYEHLHRYLFASQLVRGRDALDLASGEGYGSQILAESARSVLGIEIDDAAVEHARLRYRSDNLEFRQGSVLDLDDLATGSYDTVVCFELIEHITEHDELLSGVSRVLRSDGMLVISTPDRDTYNDGHDDPNPYHLRELNRVEFDRLLRGSFPHVAMWTQSGTVRSAMRRVPGDAPQDGGDQQFGVERVGDRWEHHDGHAAPYLVAVASLAPLPPLPTLSTLSGAAVPETQSGTIASDGLFELWDADRLRRQVTIYEAVLIQELEARERAETGHREAAEEVRRLTEVVSGLAREANRQEQAAMDFEAQAGALQDEVSRLKAEVNGLQTEVNGLQTELDAIKGSRAWNALSAYRRLRHRDSASPGTPADR